MKNGVKILKLAGKCATKLIVWIATKLEGGK